MPRRATYPWFHWFDEDQHQIPRSRFPIASNKPSDTGRRLAIGEQDETTNNQKQG